MPRPYPWASPFVDTYENGADFICAGMFDFQVREDVILAGPLPRQRPWRA